MLVTDWEVFKLRVPLAEPYTIARGSVDAFFQVLVVAHGSGGEYGLGECALYSTVGDWDGAYSSIRSMVSILTGIDSADIEGALSRIGLEGRPDLAPVAAIEVALWDLNGRAMGVPVYELLGGKREDLIDVDYTLSQGEVGAVTEKALAMKELGGYRGFCVKVGGRRYSPLEDVERVRELRRALGSDVTLRLDANEGYDVETAVMVSRALESLDIEFIEQPIAARDYDGLRALASRTAVPICVDEGLTTIEDAYALLRNGYRGYFNLKIPKCGGLFLAKEIATLASEAGIPCVCGGALALEIIRQASRHFAASVPLGAIPLSSEGAGPASQALLGNVAERVVTYEDVRKLNGAVTVSREPGLGIDLDWKAVERYAA